MSAVLDELEALYAELEAELRLRAPRCDLSGRCCDFERHGHRLFATAIEVEFARERAARGALDPRAPVAAAEAVRCPFHVRGLCELRDGRPLGCRVYFCDPAFADEMPVLAERYHRRVVEIHERHGVGYAYQPFVRAIREEPPA